MRARRLPERGRTNAAVLPVVAARQGVPMRLGTRPTGEVQYRSFIVSGEEQFLWGENFLRRFEVLTPRTLTY